MDIIVQGGDQLGELASRLKATGNGELRKKLLREIRAEVKPTIMAVRQSARNELPKKGGLADAVARSKFSNRTKLSVSTAGVRILALNPYALRKLDSGKLRHPVYGNRNAWVNQSVPPGWFSKPIQDRAPELRRRLLKVIEEISAELG